MFIEECSVFSIKRIKYLSFIEYNLFNKMFSSISE